MQDRILANAKSFPERLKAVLELRSLTPVEVAQGIDSAHSTVYRMLEPGGSKPQVRTLKRLADFLRVRKEWLADGVGAMELSEREAALAPVRLREESTEGHGTHVAGTIASSSRANVPSDIMATLDAGLELPPGTMPVRWIPVVGWTQLGGATTYEEIPMNWRDLIPFPVTGGRVFGARYAGDSMEPRCITGDLLTLLPDVEPQTGDLVVAKYRNNGIVLRRFATIDKHRVRLSAYHALYPATEHSLSEFHWVYPVHSTTRFER